MTLQNGSLVLIKISDGGTPVEAFSTIGGLRTSRLSLNNQSIQGNTLESGAWRRLIPNSGIKSLTISGAGLFSDAVSEDTLRGYAFAGSVNNYRFIFANGDYVQGPFLITAYDRGGAHNAEETYSITLASAGTLTFTSM
jgi:TP901-1 family phage major tail protein